ncbi:MAG: hypothetical protein OEM15_05750 [Myxococcales bacterium]|nr:hypothetical protein [Myxococcales bacterium]MDH3485099.1 hypothetical protein [Myxococcales bacterium]
MADPTQKSSLAAWVWVLVACVAVFELVAHSVIRARVPSDRSWRDATTFVRERFEPTDRVVAAPHWVDPIVRSYLGDLFSLSSASVGDLAGVDRVWEVAIRGVTSRSEPPALEEPFGRVRVRMWSVVTDEVLFDFVEEIDRAEVDLLTEGSAQRCPWMHAKVQGGGLGHGPLPPPDRFVCDPARPWLWVGGTVMADLDLEPRRCVWQHPAGPEPVRAAFRDVPLGDKLVVQGGLDYNNERTAGNIAVRLRVFIDDRLAGEMRHQARDGWSRLEIDTSRLNGTAHQVRIETTAAKPHARTFCWSASTRGTRGER